jgi:hypothetical protein
MKQMIAVATVAAAFAIATSSVSAQTATTSATTTDATASTATTTAVKKAPPTEATPQMISEALQRSQKRHEKFLANGTPEQWGSEEPFVYDPAKAKVQ